MINLESVTWRVALRDSARLSELISRRSSLLHSVLSLDAGIEEQSLNYGLRGRGYTQTNARMLKLAICCFF